MATYLYCVLAPRRSDAPALRLTGVGGAPVRAIVGAGLEAWVSTIDDATLVTNGRVMGEQAVLHNDVVEAALATGQTPLPARFGSRFADDVACVAYLEQHHSELSAPLTRIADAVEMSVLLVPIVPSKETDRQAPRREDPAAGRRYLEAVRERTRQDDRRRAAAASLAGRITSAVAPIIRGASHEARSAGVVSVAHLVGRSELDEYKRAIAALVPEMGYRILLAGPRAPYSFAGENGSIVGHDSSSPSRDE